MLEFGVESIALGWKGVTTTDLEFCERALTICSWVSWIEDMGASLMAIIEL